jgi:hypothetical protein
MGIKGLLPFLLQKNILKKCQMKEFKGSVIGVDGNILLNLYIWSSIDNKE